jgi:hypothetical protein
VLLVAMGCDSPPSPPDRPPLPERPASTASSAAPASSAITAPTSSTAPAASVVGAWEGSFSATKSAVTIPDNVKDTIRDKDDGKAGVGPGKVALSISADGDVTGSWTGALGKNVLRGKVEVENGRTMLRATAMPDDPTARDAMSGILVGELKGDAFHAEIHVAAGDAVAVREASLDLHHAK